MMKISLTGIMIFISVLGYSQTKNFIDQPYLETTAKVDTLITPDTIYLSILITEKDTKGKISVEELENKMTDKLTLLGINLKEQLFLSDLSSNFKKYFLRQQDVLKSKSYKLKLHDAQTAGKVIVALEQLGIANVNLEKTEYSGIEKLRLLLKSKAILKAKQQGESMVKPLNQKLGNAIYISDKYYQMYNRQLDEVVIAYSTKEKQEYEPIEIEFRKIKIESEVNVKFKIE